MSIIVYIRTSISVLNAITRLLKFIRRKRKKNLKEKRRYGKVNCIVTKEPLFELEKLNEFELKSKKSNMKL